MGLVKRKPILKCPYCRDENRRHVEHHGSRMRILPSWPFLSVNVGDDVHLFDIRFCPMCGREL